MASSSVKPFLSVRQLRGLDIHVFKEGRLFIKPSFLRPKRPCIVNLRGLRLKITTFNPKRTQNFGLTDAILQAQISMRKLTVHIKGGPSLQLYAESIIDFTDWTDSLNDALNWSFEHFYEVIENLGRGAFAVVKRARHRATKDEVAVKIITKTRCSEDDFHYLQREIDIALTLRHPNIVRTSDLFQSESNLYIVLELMPGGTLQTAVESNGPFTEEENKVIMTDILKAVKFIHSKGIVHRDLKPENILCTASRPPMSVKLIDFGLARRIPVNGTSTEKTNGKSEKEETGSEDEGLGPDGLMTTPVGTPHFVAPEILSSLPYSKEVDLFTCGVILYWLLSGRLPFEDVNATRLAERIKRVEYDYGHKVWENISPHAKDLINGMLDRSPFSRLSASAALAHPWFEHHGRNGEVYPCHRGVPGDEIVIRRWTADPGFDLGDGTFPLSVPKQTHDQANACSTRTLSSPVTPGLNATKHLFHEESDER